MVSEYTEKRLQLIEDILLANDYGLNVFDSDSRVLREVAYSASTIDEDYVDQVGVRFRISANHEGIRVFYNPSESFEDEDWNVLLLDLPAKDISTARKYQAKLVTALRAV